MDVLAGIGRDDPAFSAASDFRFSPSGRFLAVLGTSGSLGVWDLDEPIRKNSISTDISDGSIEGFSEDESRIWLSRKNPSGDSILDLVEWHLHQGRLLRTVPKIGRPLCIVPGQWIFGRKNPSVGLFHDLQSGKSFYPLMFEGRMSNLYGFPSASLDGRLLVISHDAGILTVWDTEDLRSDRSPEPVRTLGGILLSFWSSGFSPDGSRLFGCSHGSEAIKVWDTATYHELLTLAADGHNIRPPVLSPDARDLATYQMGDSDFRDDGRIFIWRAAAWEEIEEPNGS
jgi:WD40 repeat protein